MVILFSVNLPDKQRDELTERYPDQTFIFCKNMSEAKDHLAKAEVFVTYGEDLNAQLIGKAINLKWIMVMSAGLDQMPFKEIERRGIVVTNAKGIHKIQMAEYVIAMLLQVYRQTETVLENQKKNYWSRRVPLQEVTGRTMLVLGTGAIGQEVARLAKAFHMTTYGISKSGRLVEHFDDVKPVSELESFLPEADFVVSVLPSTEETRYLFTEKHFDQMKKDAVFLNMGRGDLVKSNVIIQAVEEQKIAHAVLDVFEEEPLPEDSPLWNVENITITPHLSGLSPQYLPRALEIFTENLDQYVKGKPVTINKIDGKRGY